MSIIRNIIKQNVSNLLSEDVDDAEIISKSGSATGDAVASHSAKASMVIDKVKDNLRSMGVTSSDINDIYTIDQLKSKPFDIKFTILGEKNEWGERKQKQITTIGKYNQSLSNTRDTIVLDLKDYGTIVFDKKQINIVIPGTSNKVNGLANGKDYNVLSLNGSLSIKLNEDDSTTTNNIIKLNDIGLGGEESVESEVFVTGSLTELKVANNQVISGKGGYNLGNLEKEINNQLRRGVKVRKSLKTNNTIVLSWPTTVSWPNGTKKDDETQAMLIEIIAGGGHHKGTMDSLMGDNFKNREVRVGRKVGGDEYFTQDMTGKLTLNIKK